MTAPVVETAVQKATVQLPPSERDFQVYQRVVLEGASTRQAAGDFKISQTRVRQLVQRVSQWLTETLPPRNEASDEAHLNLARHVAADRLQYLYGEAMRGWRLLNETKYAGLVLRVLAAQAKLPVIPGTLEALFADAMEGPLEDEVGQTFLSANEQTQLSTVDIAALAKSSLAPNGFPIPTADKNVCPTSRPPERDCSPFLQDIGSLPSEPAEPPVVNSTGPSLSADLPREASAARRAFFAPAQPPTSSSDLPVTELKITPELLGLSRKKVLSRRERRRLRRTRDHAKSAGGVREA